MTVPYPPRGLEPWDVELKEYIDSLGGFLGESTYQNGSGPTALVNGANTTWPGNILTMPPSDRWQVIRYQLILSYGGTGGATVYVNLFDLSYSVSVAVEAASARIEAAAGTNNLGPFVKGEYWVPPHDDWRLFFTSAFLSKDVAGDTRAVSVNHVSFGYGTKIQGGVL